MPHVPHSVQEKRLRWRLSPDFAEEVRVGFKWFLPSWVFKVGLVGSQKKERYLGLTEEESGCLKVGTEGGRLQIQKTLYSLYLHCSHLIPVPETTSPAHKGVPLLPGETL